MARSWLRQLVQIGQSEVFTDNLSSGVALESSSTNLEDDMNAVRSQLKRIIDHTAGKWYDDVPTVNSKQRSLKTLNTDLDDVEEHKFLFRAQVLTDITLAAAVAATGSITAVAGLNLTDTETFTISDGIHTPVVFEFDSGGGVTPGNVAVAFTSGDSASTVATAMRTAINTAASLDVTASGAGASVVLTADIKGSHANVAITDTVADAGFVVSGMSGGAGDMHVLVDASSETPTEVAAVDAGSDLGAVVKVLGAGAIGKWSLDLVTGQNALNPKNLCAVRDAGNDDPIMSSGKQVYALLQAQNGVVSGDNFDDSTKKVQLSFVREVISGPHGFEHVPADDIGGKTINYTYIRRLNYDTLPEWAFTSPALFIDQAAAVDVTLDNAIDNQSGPATQAQDIEWRIDDTKTLEFQDSAGAKLLLAIAPNAGNDLVQFNVDTFDVNNANSADFLNGAIFDSGGTSINVGVTAGQIDAAAKLTLASTGANDLALVAGEDLWMTDSYRAGSTWSLTDGIKLAASSAEWSAFETQYGEVSLLAAITAASQKDAHQKLSGIALSNINAGVNVTGAGGSPNLSAQLQNYSTITSFPSDVNVFVNGQLLLGATGATDDVYPGTTPANGDLKFTFKIKTGDVVTMETFANPM